MKKLTALLSALALLAMPLVPSAALAQTATTSLTLTKVVVGGSSVAADFSLFVNGMPITSGVASTTIATGTYAITETPLDPDYTATFSGDCDASGNVTLDEGEELECTITNTFTGTTTATTTSLTVTKVVVGGTASSSNFSLFLSGVPITSGVASTTLGAGTYTVTETPTGGGYTASFSGDCDAGGNITLSLGDDLDCTITNTFTGTTTATTTLTVTKVVTGGTASSSDFTIMVNGVPITSGVASTTLAAGLYTVTESPNNPDYVASFSGDCNASGSVSLALGQQLSCTITNIFNGGNDGPNGDGNSRPPTNDDESDGDDVSNDGGNTTDTSVTTTAQVFPALVFGASSFVPAPTQVTSQSGQVLGAQSNIPGIPSTGGEPPKPVDKMFALTALGSLAAMSLLWRRVSRRLN